MAEPLARAVGAPTAKALSAHLHLETVGDLLRHYPRDRRRRGQLTDLRGLEVDEHVTVLARVATVSHRPMRQRSGWVVDVVVTDGTSRVPLTFFPRHKGALAHLLREMVVGREGLFSGKVGRYREKLQLVHPEHHMTDEGEGAVEGAAMDAFLTGSLPIYPAAQGVQSWTVAKAVQLVLEVMTEADAPDPLPEAVRARHGFPSLLAALRSAHLPAQPEDEEAALERLRYEEAFVLQAELARRRLRAGAQTAVPRPALAEGGLLAAFDARLPFDLTDGQREVGEEIAADLARPHPMHRLLQGEVGSGKTVVALRAMLSVVDAGGQAALLAPTEVLAVQHHRSLTALLGDLAGAGRLGGADVATRVALLTGSQGARARRESLLEAASGQAGIVVGTHALLQDAVQFADLGLVVVDEQHRFGVEQRDALRAKASAVPHLLVMTATPIPRTVAMTSFGDLETSVLQGLPAGRSPIATHVVPAEKEAWVARMWQRVREEVDAGRQAYVVCPTIGGEAADEGPGGERAPGKGSTKGPATQGSATKGSSTEQPTGEGRGAADDERPLVSTAQMEEVLAAEPSLAGVRRGLLHGRMAPEDKDAAMRAFAAGDVDVLVATTVVEVGVDVPNATCMVVMDADRFGISQLHQLRGRVGRGGHAGRCFLVTPLPESSPAVGRLSAVAGTTDGFELAQVDLEVRGEGDVLGARQSGVRSSLRLLRVVRDADVIAEARADATAVLAGDPELAGHPALAGAIGELLRPQHEMFLERG
ncbi:ATP-dependent DNA helicase RecG [uncultured Pseudokineococcus sp.]|uniref:ATP-dependent DNA helicase RecG n=1 Tax=uncultured Pseudokineococcus sp. TaxID=1642928 RepID=UPI0034438153